MGYPTCFNKTIHWPHFCGCFREDCWLNLQLTLISYRIFCVPFPGSPRNQWGLCPPENPKILLLKKLWHLSTPKVGGSMLANDHWKNFNQTICAIGSKLPFVPLCEGRVINPKVRIDIARSKDSLLRVRWPSPNTSIAAWGGGGSFKRLKLYNSEEHLPIESFVTTLIHWTFFFWWREPKLAFVGFVAAGNSMWHQVLDDLCLVVTDQSATTCDSSYAPNSTQYNSVLQSSEKCYPSTILYYKVLLQKVLVQYYSVLLRTTKY